MGELDWAKSATELERLIRGLNPWPSAFSHLNGKTLKIWEASVEEENGGRKSNRGTVLQADAKGFRIQTGEGILKIDTLQMEGKNEWMRRHFYVAIRWKKDDTSLLVYRFRNKCAIDLAADPIAQFSKIQRSHCCVCVFRTVYRYQCYTVNQWKSMPTETTGGKNVANGTELRGIALEILLEITQEKEYSHLAIRNALNKVQYLPKQDRAFINRLVEGTLEYMLRIDYVLNQFSSVRVNKMKPVIRNILRSGVYQLMFMDSVPDPAACNEAVKLAQKKGFYSLKGFVNGVMRNVARKKEEIIIRIRTGIRRNICRFIIRYTVAGKTMGTDLRNRNNGMHVKRFSDGSSVDDPMPAVSGGAGTDGQQSERPGSNS